MLLLCALFRGIWRIHPSFRIVAVAEPPATSGGGGQQWLNSEMLTMFMFHEMRDLAREEELQVLRKRVRDDTHSSIGG